MNRSELEANRSARALLEAGRLQEAVELWREVAEELRERGEWAQAKGIGRTLLDVTERAEGALQAVARSVMVQACLAGEEFGEAAKVIRGALAVHERAGDVRSVAGDWVSLATVAEASGDLEEAAICLVRALEALGSEGSGEVLHEVLLHLGHLCSDLGQGKRAMRCADCAERVSAEWAA